VVPASTLTINWLLNNWENDSASEVWSAKVSSFNVQRQAVGPRARFLEIQISLMQFSQASSGFTPPQYQFFVAGGTDRYEPADGCTPPECYLDVSGDSIVDDEDKGVISVSQGCTTGIGECNCDASDVNGDGFVNETDTIYFDENASYSPCF